MLTVPGYTFPYAARQRLLAVSFCVSSTCEFKSPVAAATGELTNASSIIAGSETTATLLSGTLYLLLSNPATLQKLKDEIRSTFKTEKEIGFASVEHLPYRMSLPRSSL